MYEKRPYWETGVSNHMSKNNQTKDIYFIADNKRDKKKQIHCKNTNSCYILLNKRF